MHKAGSDTTVCPGNRLLYYDWDQELWLHVDDEQECTCPPDYDDD